MITFAAAVFIIIIVVIPFISLIPGPDERLRADQRRRWNEATDRRV